MQWVRFVSVIAFVVGAVQVGLAGPVGTFDPRTFGWQSGTEVIDPVALSPSRPNPFRGGTAPTGGYRGDDPLDPFLAGVKADLFEADSLGVFLGLLGDVSPLGAVPILTTSRPGDVTGDSFAGDYSGLLPCVEPGSSDEAKVIDGSEAPLNCVPNIPRDPVSGDFLSIPDGGVVEDGVNIRVAAGSGELPLRPAPDESSLLSPSGVAQGHFFPFPSGATTYERNVDTLTGRLLVAGASSDGPCATPSAGTWVNLGENGQSGVNPARGFDDPKNPLSMTSLGIGTESACLKAGGAAGGANENALGGAENALEHHPADQGLFAALCTETIGFSGVIPGACLFQYYGSPEEITAAQAGLVPPGFGEVWTATLAGELGQGNQGFLRLITNRTKTGTSDNPNTEFSAINLSFPLAPLNRDPGPAGFEGSGWDGVITAGHRSINAQNEDAEPYRVTILDSVPGIPGTVFDWRPEGAPAFDCDNVNSANIGSENLRGPLGALGPAIVIHGGVCKQFRFHHDDTDFVTLDSTLSHAQRALAGCGGFNGIRCDSVDEVYALPELSYDTISDAEDAVEQIFPEGGGIDFLTAETTAMIGGWPTDGTLTVGLTDQPWTVDFAGPAACARADGSGGFVRLPGCRGLESLEIVSDGGGPTAVLAAYDDDYLPSVDGCPVGAAIGGVPVQTVENATGYLPPSGEMTACADASEHKEGAYNVVSLYAPGAGTIFHPLAGCLPDTPEQQADFPAGTPLASEAVLGGNVVDTDCDWTARDYEAEFLGLGTPGRTAQIFRTEMAAVSWNLLLHQVAISCNFRRGDDIGNDPSCFNPKEPLRADKCSFNAPHLCREVQRFLDLAEPDSDRDGTPDAKDNCLEERNGAALSDAGGNVQLNSDGDEYGNLCDCDFDNDGACGQPDYDLFFACFGTEYEPGTECEEYDMNGDGVVAQPDYSLFISRWGGVPGPSGVTPPTAPRARAPACGLGLELVPILALLLRRRGRDGRVGTHALR